VRISTGEDFTSCDVLQRNIYLRATHNGGVSMSRFFAWFDRLALASPYGALLIFQI